MKQTAFYFLAAGLILNTGCSKPEDTPSAKPAAEQPQTAVENMVQQTETVTKQAAEKITAVTEQAQTAAAQMTQKAESLMNAVTVKPEQVVAELSQPVDAIKAKVAALGQPELLAYANTYKNVLIEKKDQLAGLTSSLKSLSMSDMFGEKGKALKDQISQYTSQLSGLKERYSVYLDKLKTFGVDLSSFGL